MRYRIDYLPSAHRDVEAVFHWTAARSAGGAASWYRACMAAIERLETSAVACGIAEEDEDHDGITIREALFKTRRGRMFRILFIVRGSVVSVLHVRSCSQGPLPPDEFRLPNE